MNPMKTPLLQVQNLQQPIHDDSGRHLAER
jgi:hypothetical protein